MPRLANLCKIGSGWPTYMFFEAKKKVDFPTVLKYTVGICLINSQTTVREKNRIIRFHKNSSFEHRVQ
jgi:hypothetical protein